MTGWTTADIFSQHGRLAVVTGATGGIGYETAFALAAAGAEVVLASRDPAKGRAALARIAGALPAATVRFEVLDLASLRSVGDFAGRLLAGGRGIDLLVNNAAVMGLPRRRESEDGFELQFATNYLGHFALTGRLLPLLRRGGQARVVNLGSLAGQQAVIDLDDLQAVRRYGPMRVYGTTKLEMLLFTLELQRRSDAQGWGLLSTAAHPGWARTDIITNGPAADGRLPGFWRVAALAAPLLGQSAAAGARPVLFAATSPRAHGGGYYGPAGLFYNGPPVAARLPTRAKDARVAAGLWQASERLTGMVFAAAPAQDG